MTNNDAGILPTTADTKVIKNGQCVSEEFGERVSFGPIWGRREPVPEEVGGDHLVTQG